MKKIIEGLTFESRVCKLSMFMSLKLLKLRWKIFFWTMTGRIKKMQSRLQLTLSHGNPENILIVFPLDEPSFRVACYAFRDLGKNNVQKRKFIFIVREQFRELFHLRIGDSMFIKHSDKDIILSGEKLLLQSLKQNKFDIIVDLNPKFQLAISRLISLLKSEMKVGFASDFSDQFYNIQLDISKSGIMEKGFKQINWILAQ
jgi:hypothetical protein|tara:strand:- start:1101 stop:1703 length:603 start_codon:yes stop_codon:yes gene_type:complete